MHGPGTVRSGRWKFYPWAEGKGDPKRDKAPRNPSKLPVQLYDTVADIGEKDNLAGTHPLVAAQLLNVYNQHIAEIKANRRPTEMLVRPVKAISSERPGGAKRKLKKKASVKRDQ